MFTVSGEDAFLLRSESPNVCMHTLKLAIIDPKTAVGPAGFERFKNLAVERLPLLLPFRCRPINAPFPSSTIIWAEHGKFDTDYHVKRVTLTPPGGEREINTLMSEVMGEPLSREHPLWQLYYVDGLENGYIAYLLKIHHSVADGAASAALATMVLQTDESPVAPLRTQHRLTSLRGIDAEPSTKKLLIISMMETIKAYLYLPILCILTLIEIITQRRQLPAESEPPLPFSSPLTRFNKPFNADRIISNATLSMADLKLIKNRFNCTVNDVYICLVGGALRRYLLKHNELPDKALSTVVPVSIRTEDEDPLFGNAISQWFTSTGSDIPDPVERLQRINFLTVAARDNFSKRDMRLTRKWAQFFKLRSLYLHHLPMLLSKVLKRPSYNVITSNVPGPGKVLYADGSRIVAIRSIGPITPGQGLNFTAWSYVDQFSITVLACRSQVPDLEQLTANIKLEMQALLDAAKQSKSAQGASQGASAKQNAEQESSTEFDRSSAQ